MKDPQPGTYTDSCDTQFSATRHPKTGWWLQKLTPAGLQAGPYPKPDFPAAVATGIFTRLPETT